QIQAHFGDGSAFGVKMHYALEPEPLGTAGAVRNAAPHIDGPIVVLNGDVLTDFDLKAVLAFHAARNAEATIAVRRVARPHAYGILITEKDDGRVREWHEPSEEEKKRVAAGDGIGVGDSDFINAGIYVLEP